jgi:hypothetical protein
MARYSVALGLAFIWLAAAAHVGRAADHPLAGSKLTIKRSFARRSLVWVSKDPAVVLPAASPTAVGAQLVASATDGDSSIVDLGAGLWRTSGDGARYRNPDAPGGDSKCKFALLRGGLLRLTCRDDLVDILDPGPEGNVTLALSVGADTYCATFGGVVRDESGRFIARRASAPASCPQPPSACCDKTRLAITTTGGTSGQCGSVTGEFTTPELLALDCGALYLGGGTSTAPGPMTLADAATLITNVTACNPDTGAITLAHRTAAETGSNRDCSAAGCLYGPPQPIVDGANPASSVCVVSSLTQNVRGGANCTTGDVSVELFLRSEVYRSGDAVPALAGVQPCPVCRAGGSCASGTCCAGGANDGADCVADNTDLGSAGPTSHDCPPASGDHVGTVFDLTFGGSNLSTGALTVMSTSSSPAHAQMSVFCGFCRGTNGFGTCSGGPTPGSSCASHADCAPGGTCGGAIHCTPFTNDAICGPAPLGIPCEQGSSGAFGEPGARRIALTGADTGALGDGAPHAATLVRHACLSPSFDAAVDAAFDLPGPVARSVGATVQLLP